MTNKEKINKVVILQSTIVVLLIIIAILAFFLGKNFGQPKTNITNLANNSQEQTNGEVAKDLTIIAIDDQRCSECYTNEIVQQLKNVPILAEASFEVLDFSEQEAKDILDENAIENIPAIIFSHNNLDPELANFLIETPAGKYSLNVGATFNPYAEICDNGIDDTGNGKIDCEDTSCGESLLCRQEEKGKLDVFLMGYCPFGEIAAKAVPSILETLKDGVNIDFHYIATKVGEGYSAEDFASLHGTPEVEEDMRQVCIKKYYGNDSLIDYMQKRYENADNYGQVTDEPSLAYDAAGIDANTIDSCVTDGEAGKLLEENIKLAENLGIGASPTWLANNKYQFGGIDAEVIKTNFCKYNPDVEGCDTVIQASTTTDGAQPVCN